MREAMFYEKKDNNLVFCRLCPKLCTIRADRTGFCRARENRGGRLFSINHGKVTSYALDPIEKKPLYHFYPGSYIFSIGTFGCNLRCGFCQNWSIAHGKPPAVDLEPADAVQMARQQNNHGYPNIGIAYTYSEPLVWFEYVLDTARLARQAGLKNVLVTNGYINEEPLQELLPYIDAMNIDIKGFTDEYYRRNCRGTLAPVLRTVEAAYERCHVELTALLVTGLNDTPEEIRQLVNWVADLDPDLPLHFSRYFPSFEVNLPATPLEKLIQARDIAREKLSYVYVGNAPQLEAGSTWCPECDEELINRTGYYIRIAGLDGRKCRGCGRELEFSGDTRA